MARLSAASISIVIQLILAIGLPSFAPAAIAILVSSDEPVYNEVAVSFSDNIKQPLHLFNLQGDYHNSAAVMPELLSKDPTFILALGAKAAVAAKKWTKERPHIPVLFAKVIDWERYDLLEGQSNIIGIAAESSPVSYLTNMSQLTPPIRRVGVIHGEHFSQNFILQAKHDAEQLGLELIVESISQPKDFMLTFKQMEERIDAYWQLPDQAVVSLENILWLRQRCINNRMVCLGSSDNMSSAGILLGMGQSNTEVGVQSAAIATRILENHQPPDLYGVVDSCATMFVVNLKTAHTMGLPLNASSIAEYNDLSLWLSPVTATFDRQALTSQ